MRRFADAWRGAFIGQLPAGNRAPWASLYSAAVRAERTASWLKVYFWRRSLRAEEG